MDTRTEIMDLGEQLIRTRGYNSFSYRDISLSLGIRNAAVHYHFPAKSDLGLAVLQRTTEQFLQEVQAWKSLPEDRQLYLFTNLYKECCNKGWVCIVGALAAAFTTLPEAMQEALREMGTTILRWLSHCLKEGRRKGLLEYEGTPDTRAAVIVSELISSLLLARVFGGKMGTSIQRQMLEDL